ncbi:exodeoxyribonuclease VII large subunit [uncultured Desulfuromonas sp.]|uniref:exodeoxyribonuclease VII large subunit n=1 Tax=uncultured Desulfuromonas sp. TaxID=181013 RepID=UPI002AAB6D75|nr:exodeoxyribonuclease VII large subunit [uncultured Desulfuromonas sp.]
MFTEAPPILTIGQLNELIRETLEDNFVQVRVRGEISNLSRPGSGHWYFTLKDEKGQIRSVMFRSANRQVPFQPEHGQQVICSGRISLYEARGDIQLICDSMEAEGYGGLQLAFEQLKKKLDGEGLFALEHKQTLPPHPQCIGVITSATGAAIHDILNILQRRAHGLRVVLRPVLVQGDLAAQQIVMALEELNQYGQCEAIIVGRGGGSLEDLQAFNNEEVARAIFASTAPVISAVGHETDYTIADFVADLRAPTPSAAAELVVKNRQELEQHLDQLDIRLNTAIDRQLSLKQQRLEAFRKRLRSPQARLQQQQQRCNELSHRLHQAIDHDLERCQHQLQQLAGRLHALSPLNTMKRGFSIVATEETPPALVRHASQLQVGQRVSLQFHQGSAEATIDTVYPVDPS